MKASLIEYWDWFLANPAIRVEISTPCLTHVLKSYQMTHQSRRGLKLTMRRIAQTQMSPRLRVVKESLEFLLDPWSKYTLAMRRRPGSRFPNWAWNTSLALQESLLGDPRTWVLIKRGSTHSPARGQTHTVTRHAYVEINANTSQYRSCSSSTNQMSINPLQATLGCVFSTSSLGLFYYC